MRETVRSELMAQLAVMTLLLAACTATRPDAARPAGAPLAACPASPNCVSSTAQDEHFVEPYRLSAHPRIAWRALRTAVAQLPRTRIDQARPHYLHAECRSRLFGFVDDLEFQLRPDERRIEVRSAARTGYSDWGVNRRRVEDLRATLRAAGVVE